MKQPQTIAPIGVFDSGRGGLYTMQEIQKLLPEYDYLFYGDNKHMPYGDRESDDVKLLSFAGIQRLFSQGCEIVIVACNTAASYAIRSRQEQYPDQKVLSVTIPGIEALIESKPNNTLVLSTAGTEKSGIIPELALRNNYQGSLKVKQLPGLAEIIEEEIHSKPLDTADRSKIIKQFVGDHAQESDTLLLACTHYGVRYDEFQELYPDKTIIDPSKEAAKKFVDYLDRHIEIQSKLGRGGTTREYRTKDN